MNVKIQLLFTDRVGIVADVTDLVAANDMNIAAMEVKRFENTAVVYLELEGGQDLPSPTDTFEMLGRIPDLREISFIETLPHEIRENRFRVILDNITEGVLSIDTEGKITTLNTMVRRMLGLSRHDAIGRALKTLNLPGDAILECLQGKSFDNVKQDVITEKGRFQFFTSGKPITDSSQQIIGAVAIMKDMKDIKLLARSLSQPVQVTFSDFIGEHPAVREAIAFAQKIAGTDSIVSLRGESGTGKELFARAIHSASGRAGSFVAINCAALPETLLESELFGYVGGAFTGAKKEGKPGLFEIAHTGTIFLDEIGEMPLNLQAKMLRLIQEQSVRRIGGAKEIPINVRIITATNKNLEQMVKNRTFREDLYYRINVLPLHLLPLRERTEDIPTLAEHFLFQSTSKLNKPLQALTQAALYKLCAHSWPGNIRELRNVIERAVILCDSQQIDVGCVVFSFEVGKPEKIAQNQRYAAMPGQNSLKTLLDVYEKQILLEALKNAQSKRKAAKELGVSHTTLLNKIKKHNIQAE